MKTLKEEPVLVTAGEISRNFGLWQEKALEAPVIVTHHGRPRVAVVSANLFFNFAGDADTRTDRVRAERSLYALLNAMTESFVAFDTDLRVVLANPAFEALSGLCEKHLAGMPCLELFPSHHQAMIAEHLNRAARTGQPIQFEASVTPGGDRRCTMVAHPYPAGSALLICNRTEEKLLRREYQSASALKKASSTLRNIGCARLNQRGVFAEMDPNFAEMSGFAVTELLDRRIIDIACPSERHTLSAAVEQTFRTCEPTRMRTRLLTKAAAEREVQLSLAPVVIDGEASGIAIAAQTLT